MRVLLAGASGQLGFELKRQCPSVFTLIAPARTELDISRPTQVERALRSVRPQLIINAAAFTAVDEAEHRPEQAFAVNATGASLLAQSDAAVFHLSTDYVFDGKLKRPYREDDRPAPLNVYGHSKLAGERQLAAANPRHLIIRSGWLFGMRGRNFVKSIALKAANWQPSIRVVDDQRGGPTPACALAQALWRLALRYRRQGELSWGIYHFGGQPPTTWAAFAQSIIDGMIDQGLIKRPPVIVPIASDDYPGAARRPLYSVLDNRLMQQRFGIAAPDWRPVLSGLLNPPARQVMEKGVVDGKATD